MIPLDSPEWRRLRDAYGPAATVPPLLRHLEADPRPRHGHEDEPWFSLWSALCHQGDVCGASYAAVPHLVRIGSAAPGPIDHGFFLLPACIEVARAAGRGPAPAPDLAPAYLGALRGLHLCAFRQGGHAWTSEMAQSVAAALAAAKGHHALAEALIDLDDDLITRIKTEEW